MISHYHGKLYDNLNLVNINQMSNLSVLLLNTRYFNEGTIARIKKLFLKKIKLNERCLDISVASNIVSMVHFDIHNNFYDFKDNKLVERSLAY